MRSNCHSNYGRNRSWRFSRQQGKSCTGAAPAAGSLTWGGLHCAYGQSTYQSCKASSFERNGKTFWITTSMGPTDSKTYYARLLSVSCAPSPKITLAFGTAPESSTSTAKTNASSTVRRALELMFSLSTKHHKSRSGCSECSERGVP